MTVPPKSTENTTINGNTSKDGYILKTNPEQALRHRIKVSDLLLETDLPTTMTTVIKQPTRALPVPPLHRTSKERIVLAPLQPPTRPTPLPHLPTPRRSSVILLDDPEDDSKPTNNSTTSSSSKPKPAKRASSDYKHAHMIAERKRRKEMKSIFEQLAGLLPSTGSKRSKWETLVDTIDYLDGLEMRKRVLIAKIKNCL